MFIDSHTHKKNPSNPSLVMEKHAFGIHPWNVLAPFNREALLSEFKKLESEQMFAIGECGLDRVRKGLATIKNQSEVFEWHLELAKKSNRPVIVHCVRAHSDIVGILKKHQWKLPFMLHDFSGNEQQIGEYLKYPVYFSLGLRIFKDQDLLKMIPLNKLLLETDDQLNVDIEELYHKAAEILNLDVSVLAEQIEKNFLRFFSHADDVRSADFINNFR